MASSWQQSGSTLDVDRSTASATSPLREELVAGPEGTGYMSDDSNARNLARGASRKLNKTLNKLNPFKVLPRQMIVLLVLVSRRVYISNSQSWLHYEF